MISDDKRLEDTDEDEKTRAFGGRPEPRFEPHPEGWGTRVAGGRYVYLCPTCGDELERLIGEFMEGENK